MNMTDDKFPTETSSLLNDLVERSRECLGENLVGVYLHGSLAMGCFNLASSDIDVLIVVKDGMELEDKQDAGNSFIELIKNFPANKLELSIVTLDALKNFQYPTPYELHFSNENVENFTGGKFDLMKHREDADLAAHFVITKNRGICLFGEPIEAMFPDVPDEYYLKSIVQDFDCSYNNVANGQDEGTCHVPIYAVLNACRMLGFIEDGLIASKKEGGKWAMEHLPKEYRSVIREALNEYAEKGSSKEVDTKLLKQFMEYTKGVISSALKRYDQVN